MKAPKDQQYILITGGAGLIGSHLARTLVSDPANVVLSLDNYFIGTPSNHVQGVEYRRGDTCDIEKFIDGAPDIVFHLGEYSRVEQSFEDVETVWRLNAAGTFAVLEFCRKRSSKIVYAGSSTKFADGGLGIDQSPYAWTKGMNTQLVKNYGKWFGLQFAITYFYNAFGPGELSVGPYASVIGRFKEQYRAGKPLTVTSPGTQRRNFTHVNDIIAALELVGEQGSGDNYGIGNLRNDYSILELAQMFDAPIEMLPPRSGNRMTSPLDTSRTIALGWTPKYDLEDYIREITDKA